MAQKLRAVIPHPLDPTLALVPLTQGYFAVISAIDAPAVGQFNWSARKDGRTFYALRSIGRTTKESLHRFIALRKGLTLAAEVDHENGNGLDCRRSNLRDATHARNLQNMRLRRDSPTGIKGVTPHIAGPGRPLRFRARVMTNGRMANLGDFETIGEAQKAVTEARARSHGEFANHGTAN